MRRLGYDMARMTREPPAVRFQAEHANALWHFDMSPSDLKQLETPPWIDLDRQGAPTLMLFSAVDDRSGVAYQEYRCVYGEDADSALRFLFNAMGEKPSADNALHGTQGSPSRQWTRRQISGLQARHGMSGCRNHHPHGTRYRWPKNDGAQQGQG
jgi:hypothetical protein